MNIKSLLLGSAAALLAVSGARAADAVVVAEPEPMEYVRICDVYGAGFYYIPGTETCLKIGGLVRYEIDAQTDDNGWNKTALARLKFDARSETEYGTFRRFIEIQHSIGGGGWVDRSVVVDRDPGPDVDPEVVNFDLWTGLKSESGTTLRHAYFEIGGLLVGHTDTLWDGDLDGEFDYGGGDRINQIRYTFDAGNGIAVSVGLEEESDNFDYVPLVVGKVSIAQGWGTLDLFAGYDHAYDEGAIKGIAKIKATDALTVELLATYESGPTYWSLEEEYVGYAWSVGGYLKYQVNDKLSVGFGGQYLADLHDDNLVRLNANGVPSRTNFVFGEPGDNNWAIGGVVDYNIVQNLDAKLAINYNDGDSYKRDRADNNGNGVVSGFLRLDAAF